MRQKLYTAYGKTQNISQWAKEYGLNRTTLNQRIIKNPDKSLEYLLDSSNFYSPYDHALEITYRGRTQSLTKWAEELGINKGTIWNRMRGQNLSFEEAISL